MATVPNNWTDNAVYLRADTLWAVQGEGTKLANGYGIAAPYAAVICTSRESGDELYLFSAAGGTQFYLWNRIEGVMLKITSPSTRQDILDSIAKADGNTAQLQTADP